MATNGSIDLDFDHFVTPWNERVSTVIVFTLASCVGVVTNGIAVSLSVFTDLRKLKVNLLIGNLAFSDLMCVFFFIVGENWYILYREQLPVSGCIWLGFINFIAAMQEFVFPPFLAVNRYMSLYHSTLCDKIYTTRNVLLMIVGTWAFSAIMPGVFALGGHMGYDIRNEHCCLLIDGDIIWTIIYWVFITGPLLGVGNTTMIFCNYKIYKKLKDHAKSSGTMLKKNVVSDNREIMYFMMIDTLIPICTHSVYHVCKFVVTVRFNLALRQFFATFYLLTGGVRGLIIIFMLRPYRTAFMKHILRKTPNKVGMTPVTPGTSRVNGTTNPASTTKA